MKRALQQKEQAWRRFSLDSGLNDCSARGVELAKAAFNRTWERARASMREDAVEALHDLASENRSHGIAGSLRIAGETLGELPL